jgi:PAS domain S-box-containing protein
VTLNKLLQRQIQKAFGDINSLPDSLLPLLKIISDSYDHNERDRRMLVRSIELSSTEMIELNEMLKKESAEATKAHDEIKMLFESIEEVFFSVSYPALNLLQMSPACEKVYGYPVRDFMDNPRLWHDVITEQDKKIMQENTALLQEGKPFTHEYRILHKDGSIRWIETKIKPHLDSTNNITRIDGVSFDITERKKGEAALQLSEKRFRSLIENNEDVISLSDHNMNLLYQSPAAERILGFTFEERKAESSAHNIHPEDIDAANQTFIQVLKNPGVPITFQHRKKHKLGHYVWVEGTLINMFENEGINAVVANYRDITRRKVAEKAIVDSESKYSDLFQTMLDGVYKSSHEGKFIDVNPALVSMLGYNSREELMAIDIKTELYFATSDREDAVLQDKSDGRSVFRLRKKDGSEIWVEDRGQYVADENGKVLYHEGTLRDVTNRIQTELQLLQSRKETDDYKKALDQSLIVSISDQDGNIKYVNDNFCRISKYPGTELIGKEHIMVNRNQLNRYTFNRMIVSLARGKVWRGEMNNISKNGDRYWLDSTIVPFMDGNGAPYQYLMISVDITEKKNVEIKIAESEENFRTIIQSSHDLIQSVSREGKFEFVNESWHNTLGYTKEELPSMKVFDIISKDHQPSCTNIFQKVMSGEAVDNFKTIFIAKNGDRIILEGNAVPRFKNNMVEGAQAFFRDVTEREKVEEKIRKNEKRFRSLTENSADMIGMMDETGKFIYVSPAVIKNFGYTYEECYAMTFMEVIHPDDIETASAFMVDVFQNPSKPVDGLTIREKCKDGSYIWAEGTITNLLNLDGVNAIVANFRNITERKEQQDALENSNNELRKSNLELDKFVYSVSHDLRAPLLSMQGIVGIIAEETKEEMTSEHINMLNGSIHRLDNFIEEILDYSRNARSGLKSDVIDFNELLNNITNDLKFIRSENRQVSIQLDIKSTGTFCTDKGRLSVVLNNLISNGIHYQDPKKENPYVNVRIQSGDKQAIIEIEDNGIGIKEEYLGKIFDMFYRVSASSTGSGLGLYIVKETVDKMHGQISVSSCPSTGTAFKLVIPNILYQ